MSTESAVKQCPKVDAWTHMDDVQFGNVPDGKNEQTVFYFASHKSMVQYEAKRVARLIAAAPAMLHLLEESLPQLRWGSIHGSRCDALIAEVEAAIKQAKGE